MVYVQALESIDGWDEQKKDNQNTNNWFLISYIPGNHLGEVCIADSSLKKLHISEYSRCIVTSLTSLTYSEQMTIILFRKNKNCLFNKAWNRLKLRTDPLEVEKLYKKLVVFTHTAIIHIYVSEIMVFAWNFNKSNKFHNV